MSASVRLLATARRAMNDRLRDGGVVDSGQVIWGDVEASDLCLAILAVKTCFGGLALPRVSLWKVRVRGREERTTRGLRAIEAGDSSVSYAQVTMSVVFIIRNGPATGASVPRA